MNDSRVIGRQAAAEFFGSMILVVTAIAPIVLGYNVLEAGIGVAVLMDAIAVGFVLFVLIETLGPVSGCHINPAVTFAMVLADKIDKRRAAVYVVAQMAGGVVGVLAAHAMFYGNPFFEWAAISAVVRNNGTYFAEFLGTVTLIVVIFGTMYHQSKQAGLIIGLLVGGFLITTSSTMFANPQVTFARMFTWAAAGIRPSDAAVFIVVQFAAAFVGTKLAIYLFTDSA